MPAGLIPVTRRLVWLFCFLPAILPSKAPGAQTTDSIRVALFVDAKCTDERSREAAWKILANTVGIKAERVTTDTVMAEDFPGRCNVLVLPGGTGGGQGRAFGKIGGRKISEFIRNGGGLVAICAGGYYCVKGGNEFTRELDVVNSVSWDGTHWARGEGFISVELLGVNTDQSSRTMWFENGPLFWPAEDPTMSEYTPLVRYVSDLAAKDAPTGMMKARHAVVAAPFGRGRVVAFGPHPELSPGLSHWLVNSVRWASLGELSTTPTVQTVLEQPGHYEP